MDLKAIQARVQKFGATLSDMVMPNIGVFIGWGLLAALFIPTGWMPNKLLNSLVSPIITYLLPTLIGYTAGANIYGRRGGVIGAFATLGVVVGSNVTMLVGGMIMGPVVALLLRKFDQKVKGHIKPGIEMLIDNFSLGIIGFLLVVIGFLAVAPIITSIQNFLSAGVNIMMKHDILPLTSLLVQPAQILFLNNAINHGIMVPLGLQQAAGAGKSILFLVEANGAIWLGLVLAFSVFGKGVAKRTAPGAAVIMFLGGIAEVCFPYCLMMPLTILGPMAGNIFSLTVLSLFHGGTVGPVSPGSVFAFYMMTPKDSVLVNTVAYFGACIVSFVVTGAILKLSHQPVDVTDSQNATEMASNDVVEAIPADIKYLGKPLQRIIFACDAGMGSSAMGASILSAELQKKGMDPQVDHMAIAKIGEEVDHADLIVTNNNLEERAHMMSKDQLPILTVKNFMDRGEYKDIVAIIGKMFAQDPSTEMPTDNDELDDQSVGTVDADIMPEKNIVLDASFRTKKEAINACADLLIAGGYASPEYRKEMFARDEDVSVYMGNGVALPHGLTMSDSIKHSGICFIQVPQGVDFDGNKVYLIVGLAGKGEEHIQLLGKIAQSLTEEGNIDKLRTATDKQQIIDILDINH